MADMMTFPETWEEFEKSYGFDDSEEVYTNGSRLIPSFRVKQWLDHIAHLESKRQATVSSDCISRQAAIDAVAEWHDEAITNRLNNLPSAQQERKKGEWISNDIDPEAWNFCSVCGEQAIDLFDFCPNCGADMRGEQDEID